MADELDIRITTSADTAGVEEAKEAIASVADASKEASDSTAESTQSAKEAFHELKNEAESFSDSAESIKEAGEYVGETIPPIVRLDEGFEKAGESAASTGGTISDAFAKAKEDSGESVNLIASLAQIFGTYKDEGVKAQDAVGQATEEVVVKKSELNKVLKAITHQSPIVGSVLKVALNPLVGGTLVAIGALKTLHAYFDELAEKAKIGGEFKGFAETFKSQEKALQDAQLAMSSYERKMSETIETTKRLSEFTELGIDILKRRAREQDAERSADLARLKAEIDAREKAGKIDSVEAMKLRAEAEQRFAREKLDRETDTARAVVEARQKEKASLSELLPEEEKRVRELQRSFALAETPETVRSRLEAAGKGVEAAKAELAKAPESGERRALAIQAKEVAEATLKKEQETAFQRIDEYNAIKESLDTKISAVKTMRARLDALGSEIQKLLYETEPGIASQRRVFQTEAETRAIEIKGAVQAQLKSQKPAIAEAAAEARQLSTGAPGKQADALAKAIEDKHLAGSREAIEAVISKFTGVTTKMDQNNQELYKLVFQRIQEIERKARESEMRLNHYNAFSKP